MAKKRGRKAAKGLCDIELIEYDYEDLVKVHNVGIIPHSTYVHKKYKNNLPDDWIDWEFWEDSE